MTKRAFLLPCLAVAVLATGCGSAERPAPAATAATLQQSDFPAGFVATHPPAAATSPCEGFEAAKRGSRDRAKSATFRLGDSKQADNVVLVYADVAAAKAAFARMSADGTLACHAGSITKALASQPNVTVGDLHAAPLELAELGDERKGMRADQSLTVDGVEASLIVDFALVRSGRGVTLELFTDALEPFGDDLRDRLLASTTRRLSA
jgi:hypothetical protein